LWADPAFDSSGLNLAFSQATDHGSDIWVLDLQRGVVNRLTTEGINTSPAWTPDGQRIAFTSTRDQLPVNIYWQRIDGVGGVQALTTGQIGKQWPTWHPDGRTLVYQELRSPPTLMVLSIDGDEKSGWKPGTPTPFFASSYSETMPAFSPDGRWLAYTSNLSGSVEVYVRPFPGPGGATLVSQGGGALPTWSRTRPELLYRTAQETTAMQIMVVPYSVNGGVFRPEKPRPWTNRTILTRLARRNMALHPDGKRFAVAAVPESATAVKQDKLVFVFNFFDELRRITGQ
jgi:Tol biopolymer transport system component